MTTKARMEIKKRTVTFSYLRMMLYSTFTVLSAVWISYLVQQFYPLSMTSIVMLEYTGYVCWGTTLGAWGSKILSRAHQESPAEILDQKLTTFFSMFGIFVFTMSRALETFV
jgi:hypothetical protein